MSGDTKRGDFPDKICSDCCVKGCSFLHDGDIVPEDTLGSFCSGCWTARNVDFNETGIVKPLGTVWRLVPEEFADKAITVQTKSGSVYILDTPLGKTSVLDTSFKEQFALHRLVIKQGTNLPFTHAAIMLLRIGQPMFLVYFTKEEVPKIRKLRTFEKIWARAKVYSTTPVVSINYLETKNGATREVTQSEEVRLGMESLS